MDASRRTLSVFVAVGMLTACSSADGSTESSPIDDRPAVSPSTATATLLDPARFAVAVDADTTTVINVHIPDEGSIAGTDAAIPYDQLDDRLTDLPDSRAAPLAIYCKTGRMSAVAAATLAELGYTNVVELAGGMQAWTASGRSLLRPAG